MPPLAASVGVTLQGGHVGSARRRTYPHTLGKLLRIEIRTGAAETLTRGHRNPQGLARDAAGDLWATEHGGRGGDELNLLEPGEHYGWPQVSYGFPYTGPGSGGRHDGFTRPVFAWVPSPGVSALVVNDPGAFPLWDDDLLIASLNGTSYTPEILEASPRGQSIYRVRRRGRVVQYVERILVGDGPIRDLAFLPDGQLGLLQESFPQIKLLRRIGERCAFENLRVGAEERTDGRGDRSLSHRIPGITPGWRYYAQLRTRGADGEEAYSEVVAAEPDRDGGFVLRWEAPEPLVCRATHEFRLRADGETEWRPWRRFVPRYQ